jgi:hypothetical protein
MQPNMYPTLLPDTVMRSDLIHNPRPVASGRICFDDGRVFVRVKINTISPSTAAIKAIVKYSPALNCCRFGYRRPTLRKAFCPSAPPPEKNWKVSAGCFQQMLFTGEATE